MRLVFLVFLLLVAACDRPFVPVTEPDVRPVDSALFTTVQTTDSLDVRLRVTSFRAVEKVQIDGVSLAREPRSDVWAIRVPLAPGLNALAVRATDAGGVVGIDTLFTFRLAAEPSAAPDLPAPRAGHTATVLADGRVLIAGGVDAPGGAASDEAFVLSSNGTSVSRLESRMRRARVGHTASLLPDGRVLILGGRTVDGSRDLATFVDDAEVFDPQTNAFSALPVQGSPIARAHHTAFLRSVGGRLVVEVLGGEGNIDFASTPRFGIRDDLRPFEVTNESLVSLSPGTTTGQGSPVAPMAGHLTTRLAGRDPDDGDFLIAGAYFDPRGTEATNLVLRVRQRGLGLDPAPPMQTPRIGAAAVRLEDGLVLVLGGRTGVAAQPVPEGELFVAAARRYFIVPEDLLASPVSQHALVRLDDGRVCRIGGFGADGKATASVACVALAF